MHLSLMGNPKSGKSTVAVAILVVIAMVRAQLAGGKRKAKKKGGPQATWPSYGLEEYPVPLVGIATERTSGITLEEWNLHVKRTRTLRGIRAGIAGAAGGLAVLDTSTAAYEMALETWRGQSNAHRETVGLSPLANLTPSVWSILNKRYRESITQEADERRVDLVEVHRQGVGFVLHPDYGLIEGEGLRARGQAESGSPADMLLWIDGGMRSKSRATTDRQLAVISDPAELLVGRPLELPELRNPRDRADLVERLYQFLAPSLEIILPRADRERELWAVVRQEEQADDWPEARELAERGESERLVDTVKLVLMRQGVQGQSEEAKMTRTEALLGIFGVGDVSLLLDVPVSRLRDGVPALERWLSDEANRRAAVALQVNAWQLALARRGLDGGKAIQKAIRNRALLELAGVETMEELNKLSAEKLRGAVEALPGWLEAQGIQELAEP